MSFENQGNLPGQQRDNKKKKIVIAQVDIDQQARDIGEERLLSSKAELKGFRGFLRKVWKHNLAHEFYRQEEIAKARQEIQQSGNLYAGEKGEKTDHENAMKAIVQRLAMEYDDEFSRGGEEEKNLRDENPEEKNLKKDVQDLIKNFATGKISEEQFNLEKNKLFNVKLDGIKDLKGKDFAKKGSLYADNLLEVAKQIKDNISHNKGLDALDKDFEIVLGKAKAGVDTEANYNNVDKIIEKIQKSSVGKLFGNEVAISLGVSAIYGVAVKGSISAAQKTVKWIAPVVGMAASAAIGGAVAGFRESKRVKEERAQHGREMAKGGKGIEKGSENREEMEKSRYETKDATELSVNLQKALEELKNQPDEKKFSEVLDKYNEIGFRAAVASRDKIDLISFSDAKKVEEERTRMYKICSETKAYLEENAGKGLANFCRDNKELEAKIKQGRLAKIENFAKEKEIKDEIFNKIKGKKVRAAVAKGIAIGLGASLLMQEVGAATGISGGSKEGLFNSNGSNGTHPDGQVRSLTFLKACRDYIFGDTPKMPSTNGNEVMQEHIVETKKYVENNKELFSRIRRGVWADNDTIKPDKNELRMHWGGEKGSGVDANGNYVFNIKHMTHGGSFHGGKHWDPQELMKEGKIKMLISLSKDTQNQVVEIPFDANGNAIIDPNSEIGKLAFENIDGHAKFIGKFAEVAVMGENKDGIDSANILATLKGDGIEGVSYITPEPKPEDIPVDYEIDTPYVIPIVPHNPLEKLKEKKKGDDGIKYKETFSSAIKIEKETDPVRAAAMHTIYNFENSAGKNTYAEDFGANDKDWKEREEKFAKLTRKFWNEITIHGFAETNPKTGKVTIKKEGDLDGRGFLKMLELAGIKIEKDKISYVNKGETAGRGIVGDTSNENGVVSKKYGELLIIDHHSKDSDRSTSATKFAYNLLVEMGLLKKETYLDNFVEFVTKRDNENFTEKEDAEIYKNYSHNLYGLCDKLETKEVLEFFKKDKFDPAKSLSPDYLKEYKYKNGAQEKTLISFGGELNANKKKAEKIIDELEKEGFVLNTGNRFGKILIDTKIKRLDGRWFAKVPQIAHIGRLAVRVKGFGGYLIWSDAEKSFVLYTKKKMDEASIPGGFPDPENAINMRGHMLIKNVNSTTSLKITLEDILGKLSGKADFKIEGKLKEVLEKETQARVEESKALKKPAAALPSIPVSPPNAPTAPQMPASAPPSATPEIPITQEQAERELNREIEGLKLLKQDNGELISGTGIFGEDLSWFMKEGEMKDYNISTKINILQHIIDKNAYFKFASNLAQNERKNRFSIQGVNLAGKDVKRDDMKFNDLIVFPKTGKYLIKVEPQLSPGNVPDQKQEKIANSVKKMNDLFSNFELGVDAIKEESKKAGVDSLEIMEQFIENNGELKNEYEAKSKSLSGKEKEKLAMTIILNFDIEKAKEEQNKIDAEIKTLNQKKALIKDDQERQELENKINDLEDERLEIGHKRNLLNVSLIRFKTSS